MTLEEAKLILHPDTMPQTVAEIEYYGGFNGAEAVNTAIHEALIIASDCISKQIPKRPIRVYKNIEMDDGNWKMICPACKRVLMERITTEDESYPRYYDWTHHCRCGQALELYDN